MRHLKPDRRRSAERLASLLAIICVTSVSVVYATKSTPRLETPVISVAPPPIRKPATYGPLLPFGENPLEGLVDSYARQCSQTDMLVAPRGHDVTEDVPIAINEAALQELVAAIDAPAMRSFNARSETAKRLAQAEMFRLNTSSPRSSDEDWRTDEVPVRRAFSCGYAPDPAQSTVDLAAKWLARYQESDGHWSAEKFRAPAGSSDVSETSLALLSLLGNGNSERSGIHINSVCKAIEWLILQQQNDGSFCDKAPVTFTDLRPTILAALALTQAAWLGHTDATISAAQRTTDFCIEHVDRKMISFQSMRDDADFVTVGWYIQLLKMAKLAWVEIEYDVAGEIAEFVDCSSVYVGRDPNDQMDIPIMRYGPPGQTKSARYSNRSWVTGILALQYLNRPPEVTKRSLEALMGQFGVPQENLEKTSVDFDYWYFGSLAAFHEHGPVRRSWQYDKFATRCAAWVTDKEHWDCTDANTPGRSRVSQTAMIALCLEIGGRYHKRLIAAAKR